jgi:hypothetical protein
MKNFTLTGIFLIFCSQFFVEAQQGLEGVIVEKIPVSAQAVADDPLLPENAQAYRVFVDMSSGFEMQAVFAETRTTVFFGTTTKFYNNGEEGGTTGRDIPFSQIATHPALAYDSYITVNAAASNMLGILLEEDVVDGIVDGYTSGTALNLQTIGADFDQPFGFDEYTGNFKASDCAYNVLGGEQGPTNENRVLIGQFTTDGVFSFKINIQLREILTGNAEQYVAELAFGLQYVHPELHFPGPIVNITAPANDEQTGPGQNLEILADASNPFGISHLEFFVNEVKIAVDSTAPYSALWNTVEGAAELITVAWDSLGLSDTSDLVTIMVQDLIAPTVEIIAPASSSSYPVNQNMTISVTASDEDGNITLVEFYANDVKIGEDNTSPFELNWIPATAGQVVLHAVSIDDDNLQSASSDVNITITPLTAIEEVIENGIMIYPNPVRSVMTVELPEDMKTYFKALEITDVNGRLCLTKTYANGSGYERAIELDLSAFSSGLYHVVVKTTDGDILSRKFIIE